MMFVSQPAPEISFPCEKRHFFLNFSYVCPEPVLVKCSFLFINGAKSGVFRTDRHVRVARARASGQPLAAIEADSPLHNPLLNGRICPAETPFLWSSLSRACLGKCSCFIHVRMASKKAFVSAPQTGQLAVLCRAGQRPLFMQQHTPPKNPAAFRRLSSACLGKTDRFVACP